MPVGSTLLAASSLPGLRVISFSHKTEGFEGRGPSFLLPCRALQLRGRGGQGGEGPPHQLREGPRATRCPALLLLLLWGPGPAEPTCLRAQQGAGGFAGIPRAASSRSAPCAGQVPSHPSETSPPGEGLSPSCTWVKTSRSLFPDFSVRVRERQPPPCCWEERKDARGSVRRQHSRPPSRGSELGLSGTARKRRWWCVGLALPAEAGPNPP